MLNQYRREAAQMVKYIKMLAEKPKNLQNFECYLATFFDIWLKKYASDPENMVAELKHFAEMEI